MYCLVGSSDGTGLRSRSRDDPVRALGREDDRGSFGIWEALRVGEGRTRGEGEGF